MNTIQLYIGSDRIDMFNDESVSITQTIKNIKDISKVFTTFSREFTVPASKANNKIFKHYYNFDIVNGFDARVRQNGNIELNSLPFVKGKIKLNGVTMRDNKPHSYRLSFFGSVIELKDILGDDKLTSLTALDKDFPYGSTQLLANLKRLHAYDSSNTEQQGYSLPLITHSQRLYYDSQRESEQSGNLATGSSVTQGLKYTELKYAVRLDKIIAAIENEYSDITFASGGFFDPNEGTDVSSLYMWCHRKKGGIEDTRGTEEKIPFTGFKTYSSFTNNVMTIGGSGDQLQLTVTPANDNYVYDLIIYRSGSVYERRDKVTGEQYLNITNNSLLTSGTTFEFRVRVYENEMEMDATLVFTTIENVVETYTVSNYNFDNTYQFKIKDQIPEMRIIDFLTSLFQMFNLVAYTNDDGEIEVHTLDDYYTTSEYDISKYVEINESKVDNALPFKQITFKYQDSKSIIAAQHLQQTDSIEWGANEYTDAANLDGDVYRLEPKFHHTKYEKILDSYDIANDTGVQWGYFVDDNEEAYLGSPLITFINARSANVDVSFLDTGASYTISTSDTINMPTNLKTINNSSSNNIHFDSEVNEYTYVEATESLFKRFYQSYIENIFNSKNRLTSLSAYLPLGLILKIQLSDIIVINNRKYRINSMNINLMDGKTDFELTNYYA